MDAVGHEILDLTRRDRAAIRDVIVHPSTPPTIMAQSDSPSGVQCGGVPVDAASRRCENAIEVDLHGIGALIPRGCEVRPGIVGKVRRCIEGQIVGTAASRSSKTEIERGSIPFKEAQPVGRVHTTVGLKNSIRTARTSVPSIGAEPHGDGAAFVGHPIGGVIDEVIASIKIEGVGPDFTFGTEDSACDRSVVGVSSLVVDRRSVLDIQIEIGGRAILLAGRRDFVGVAHDTLIAAGIGV